MGDAKLVCLALALAVWLGFWTFPPAAQAQAGAYAVQVAAFESPESAEELAQGLRARGLDAYWVKTVVPGKGTWYRVRIGKFPSRNVARNYAERLLQSELLDSYFIFAYERPTSEVASSARPATTPTIPASPVPAPSASAPPAPDASATLTQSARAAIIAIASHGWSVPAPSNVIAPSAPVSLPTIAAASRLVKIIPPPVPVWAPQIAIAALPPPPPVGAAVNSPPVARNPELSQPGVPLANVSMGEKPRPAVVAERGVPNLAPPLLQGVVQSHNGQLQMTLRNLDGQQTFRGVARVSVGNGEQQSETAPVQLALGPNEERSFTLSPTLIKTGSYMMMIYDAAGAVRLIRGASLDPSATAKAKLPEPVSTAPPANDITVVPRQVAATSENITIEFEITSQRPLGYISLTLRAANLTDVKRAVLTTPQGRIPFLVPVRGFETVFSYELKDETDHVLVSGEDDFRRLAGGNVP